MKPLILTSIFLFLVFSAKSQIEKGTFMAEGGVNLVSNSTADETSFTEGFGFWHLTQDRFVKYPGGGTSTSFSYGSQTTGFSIGPRLGYSIARNLVCGIDYKCKWNWRLSNSSDHSDRFRTGQLGIFVRKYFGSRALIPFIEGGIGGGKSHVTYWSSSSGGGEYELFYQRDLFYLYGAGGISYSVKPNFCVNLYAKAQHTKDSPLKKSNYSSKQDNVLETNMALVLSVSYFMTRKAKQ